jgi:hypothetical protein
MYFAPLVLLNTKPVLSNTPFGAMTVSYSMASLGTNDPVGEPADPKLVPIYKRIVADVVPVFVKLMLHTVYVVEGTM